MIIFHELFDISLSFETPILCLPGKEIKEHCEGLTNDTKCDPEDAVPNHSAAVSLPSQEKVREGDKRDLPEHASHCHT